jgi:hypothetical protein
MQQEVLDFIEFGKPKLLAKHESALLSERALAADWNRPEEDEAWASYQ